MIVPQESFAQLIRDRLGGVVTGIEPIKHGMAHRMYSAFWEQGDSAAHVVVRCFHGLRAADNARAESQALSELASDNYPVPEVYLLVDDPPLGETPFIVMQYIEGEMLTNVALANPARMDFWLERASDLLLRLHGVNWQNGYELLQPVLAPLEFAERQIRWWSHQSATLEPDDDLQNGFSWLRANLYRTREVEQQSLVHRDFQLDNILSDGERITGVIDWGELTIADPALDVGWTRMILTTEANPTIGDSFTSGYTRRNPAISETLAFWEMFAACKRLTIMMAVKADQLERLAMWSGAADLPRLVNSEAAVRTFIHQRMTNDEDNG